MGSSPCSVHENPLKRIQSRLPADFSGLRQGIDPDAEEEKLPN
ncbi:MAG: hypothetical protein ANABAC_1985 [Anaerolineae bacterium]|nr:MAG: hypothetical protein ANABAC_1985 [Anaerolineae bacterium]